MSAQLAASSDTQQPLELEGGQAGECKSYNYDLPSEPIDYNRQILVKQFCDDPRIYDEDIQEAAWHRANGTIEQFHNTTDLRKRRVAPWQKKFLVRLRFFFAVNDKLEFIHSPEKFRGRLRPWVPRGGRKSAPPMNRNTSTKRAPAREVERIEGLACEARELKWITKRLKKNKVIETRAWSNAQRNNRHTAVRILPEDLAVLMGKADDYPKL